MGIFSKKLNDQGTDVKFVGVHLPHDLNSYLTLYSLCTGESKTNIIINLLKNWKEEYEANVPIEGLTESLCQIALKALDKAKERKGFIFTIFRKETEKELEVKGINSDIIEIVKRKLNEANKTS